jgi:hypothetical protein
LTTWEHADTPLARAFTAALARSEAIAEPDTDSVCQRTREQRGAMLVGTDMDADELQAYTQTLAQAYAGLLLESVQARGAEGFLQEFIGSPAAQQTLGEILRGAIVQGTLIGHYHRSYTEPSRSSTETGGPYARPEPILFAAHALRDVADLRDEQRAELSRDSVQWVFDMEADRLERIAPTLGALGLHAIAEAFRRMAAALRDSLESL